MTVERLIKELKNLVDKNLISLDDSVLVTTIDDEWNPELIVRKYGAFPSRFLSIEESQSDDF